MSMTKTSRNRRHRWVARFASMLVLLLWIPTLTGCSQAGELRDTAEDVAEEAAQQAGEAAQDAAESVGDAASDAADSVGEAAGEAADAAEAAAGAAAGMAGAALAKLGDFLGGWRDQVDETVSGLQADADAVAADPDLLEDAEWRAGADAKVADLREQAAALREQAEAVDEETAAALRTQADSLDKAAMDFEAALETGDVSALSTAAAGLASARDAIVSALEVLNTDLLAGAGDAMGAVGEAAGAGAAAAAGMAGAALAKLGDFLGGWRDQVDETVSGLQADADAVAADPDLLEDAEWRAGADAKVADLREQAAALREQAESADEETAAALRAQAESLDKAAMDFEAALETGDVSALSTAAAGLASARDAIVSALDALNTDLLASAGDAMGEAMGVAGGLLGGLGGVLEGWRSGTTDAIGALGQGAAELEGDASLMEDAGWMARMRDALSALRAKLPEGGDADATVQAALDDWQSESAQLADEIEAALDAGDAAGLRVAIGRLREAASTAFGPGADFAQRPLAGGEESLPVDPVSGDDDDEASAPEGADMASEDEDAVEQPATLPRTGGNGAAGLPSALTLVGFMLLACGTFLRRFPIAMSVER